MIITLLDLHNKQKLWQVKKIDKIFYLRQLVTGKVPSWRQRDIKNITAYFACDSWYSLQKLKINTAKFRGWKGFGYRKSAYSTWLVDSYFKNHSHASTLKYKLLESASFIKHCKQLPSHDALHHLSIKVQALGQSLFNGFNSFSHYGDFDTVNWQEITLSWAKTA